LAFSIPVTGTVDELKSENRLNFVEEKLITRLLRQLELTILSTDIYTKTLCFHSSIDAIRSLKLTGTNINFNKISKHFYTKQRLDDCFVDNNQFQLTYRIALFVVRKE